MNLLKFGVAIVATGLIAGTVSACTNTVNGISVAQEHNKLSDWIEPGEERVIDEGWRLAADKVLYVKPELEKEFFGVGIIGDHEQCLVVYWKYDEHMRMNAKVFHRFKETFAQSTPWPLDQVNLGVWVIQQRARCNELFP